MALSYRITSQMWRVWTETQSVIPGVRLGGIYANKPYYHSSVEENLAKWAPNYSIRVSLDLNGGNRSKARAIDWTMSGTEMRKRTKYLSDSAVNPDDDRLRAMREFYGTLDGRSVFGLIKTDEDGPWKWSTSDSSHLWHIHGAVFAVFVASWTALEGIVSVMSGESLASWLKRKGAASVPSSSRVAQPTLREGDEGPEVGKLQSNLNDAGGAGLAVDNRFGPRTGDALAQMQRRAGITIDRIYGPDTAGALRTLLEDDMQADERIPFPEWGQRLWGMGEDILVRTALASGYAHSREAKDRTKQIQAELAAAKKRDEAILAKLNGADTRTILDAINARAAEDAERDAEIMALVEAASSGRLDAADVVRQIGERLTRVGE